MNRVDRDMLACIEAKRDGQELTSRELAAFVRDFTAGRCPDYQAAALLMAIYFQGLSRRETHALTQAMLASGVRADLSDVAGPKIGKHSTGGVGDKVSLLAGPMAAACGVVVPKLSGRGLGHTGGTLDKLEAIPGLRTDLSLRRFARVLGATGLCFAGQTADIAPADKKLYALRDVTGTVAHAGLIAASIMSKKLAENLDGLVLDVKAGRGAFMPDAAGATELARAMADIGARAGVRVTALVTAMDEPLGARVGNALEVEEALALLRGEEPPGCADLQAVCGAVAGAMLVLGGRAATPGEGAARALATLRDGSALARFLAMAEAQGADMATLREARRLGRAPRSHVLRAERDGVVAGVDALAVGRGCVRLGAGRLVKNAPIDPLCGVILRKKTGDRAASGEPLAEIRYSEPAQLEAALPILGTAWDIRMPEDGAPVPGPPPSPVLATISST
jgi:pyrimidine-nucleoside phosphorylase/thymidine phosphorylase